jgi:hypothetical protein
MPPNKVERRYVSIVEILDTWINSTIRREMIYRRRLNAWKETYPMNADLPIISPSK